MREIVSPLSGIRSPFGGRVDPYKVLGFKPALVADMSKDYFRNVSRQTFDDIFTHSRLGNATMVDSDGLVKWAPHNLLPYSEDFSNAAWTKTALGVSGSVLTPDATSGLHSLTRTILSSGSFQKTFTVAGLFKANGYDWVGLYGTHDFSATAYCAFNLSTGEKNTPTVTGTTTATSEITHLGDGLYFCALTYSAPSMTNPYIFIQPLASSSTTRVTYSGDGVSGVQCLGLTLYRSDLGGMAPVPVDARVAGSTTYVPTTSTAKYLPRRHNHTYNGSAWGDAGTLIETEARTQLLHTTNALVTQSHTVTAVPHTLHFTGTGTVTLSGASTAGPLVGTGTGEENRVSLTFTPTAASLTLTVTGTVTDAQLEAASTPSSYIPNLAGSGTVNRAADSPLTIAGADVPWPTPTVIGDELVTNGGFDADLTGWVDASVGLAFSSVVSGQANINNDTGDGLAGIGRSFTTEVGKVYRLTADLVSTLNGARIGIGNSANSVSIVDSGEIETAGAQEFFFVATATTTFVNVYTFPNAVTTANQTSIWDNISVKEINPLAVCIQIEGDATGDSFTTLRWYTDANNYITQEIGASDFTFEQAASGTVDSVTGGSITSGVNVPFNVASYHGSTFVGGAVSGTALTADETPVALADQSGTDLQIAYDFMGNVKVARVWVSGITDVTSGNLLIGGATS